MCRWALKSKQLSPPEECGQLSALPLPYPWSTRAIAPQYDASGVLEPLPPEMQLRRCTGTAAVPSCRRRSRPRSRLAAAARVTDLGDSWRSLSV
eukprot:361221-Chlamydomonas_euryale.AAC.2